jgi:beta-N-acetylhexosaminidase
MNRDLLKKAGKMFVAGFDGMAAGEHTRFCSKELCIGNWILFIRNVDSPRQLMELNSELSSLTLENNGLAPFITIDQEGGIVSRLHGEMNLYPGAMACSAAGIGHTARTARIMAGHLKKMGFNMNLAPVADINCNPRNPIVGPRSYGETPEIVSEQILEFCEATLTEGIIPVVKHFPGHGDTEVDSHLALPSLPFSRKELEQREMVPFIRAIEEEVPAIMVAHMLIPSLDDSGLPSSLSKKIIQQLLRESLGFKGLVLTDCLEMQGVQASFKTEEAVKKAVTAGADLLFISHSAEEQEKGVKVLYDEMISGRIPESRIDESIRRMDLYQKKYCGPTKTPATPTSAWSGEDIAALRETSRKSLTVLKSGGSFKQSFLKDNPRFLILHLRRPEQFIGENTVSGGDPAAILVKAYPKARYLKIKPEELEGGMAPPRVKTEEWDRILLVCSDLFRQPRALKFAQSLLHTATPCMVAVMRTPYEAGAFSRADTLVLCYEDTVAAYTSLSEYLRDDFEASGICPVTIPGLE